jgi:hypothetical protein
MRLLYFIKPTHYIYSALNARMFTNVFKFDQSVFELYFASPTALLALLINSI